MDVEKGPDVLTWDHDPKVPSFESMLDTTCDRLLEKHIRYSIRRLGEMEEELIGLEKELDAFLCHKQ